MASGRRLILAKRAAVPLSCLAVLWWPAWTSASDAFEPTANSTQARARGGADVAVGDTALSQIDNPATLSLAPRGSVKFDNDAEIGIISMGWRGPAGSAKSERRVLPLVNSAVAIPITDGLTLGTAFNSKAGFGSAYHLRHLLMPFMERRIGSDLKVINVPLNAAYKVTDKLSLGLGSRVEMATAKFSTVLGPAAVDFGRGYAVGGGIQGGLHYKLREDIALGLGYRSPTWFNDLKGGRGKASLFGVLPVSLGDVSLDELELPQRLNAGVAWDATKWLKLVGEARWINYSASSLHKTTIATDGLVNLRYPFPLGYRDQGAFIAGAEFKIREHWKLGVGYHYATPAAPEANVIPIGSIPVQHHVTVGLRYESKRGWAGAGYVIGFPASLHGPGYSRIPLALDYGSGELRQTQHGIFFGAGLNF